MINKIIIISEWYPIYEKKLEKALQKEQIWICSVDNKLNFFLMYEEYYSKMRINIKMSVCQCVI